MKMVMIFEGIYTIQGAIFARQNNPNILYYSIGLLTVQERLWKVTQRWRFCPFFGVFTTTISQMQNICDGGIVLFSCIYLKATVNTIKIVYIKIFGMWKG